MPVSKMLLQNQKCSYLSSNCPLKQFLPVTFNYQLPTVLLKPTSSNKERPNISRFDLDFVRLKHGKQYPPK